MCCACRMRTWLHYYPVWERIIRRRQSQTVELVNNLTTVTRSNKYTGDWFEMSRSRSPAPCPSVSQELDGIRRCIYIFQLMDTSWFMNRAYLLLCVCGLTVVWLVMIERAEDEKVYTYSTFLNVCSFSRKKTFVNVSFLIGRKDHWMCLWFVIGVISTLINKVDRVVKSELKIDPSIDRT